MEEYLWIIWLIAAVAFIVIEGVTIEFISLWFALSSLVSMILALCKVEFGWQLGVFISLSIILIVFTRPIITRHLKRNESKTNVDSYIGEVATVTKDILPDDRGEAKLNGQYWLAISSTNEKIEANTKVTVLAVEGAKLIVKKYVETL